MEMENEVRSKVTLRFSITQFSKMKDMIYSPSCYIHNLPWKIKLKPEYTKGWQKGLCLYLQWNAERENGSWSCYGKAEFRLLSVIPDGEPYFHNMGHWFCLKEKSFGYNHFVAWNDILDPKNGYIKDDTITIEVDISATTPTGDLWDSRIHMGAFHIERKCSPKNKIATLEEKLEEKESNNVDSEQKVHTPVEQLIMALCKKLSASHIIQESKVEQNSSGKIKELTMELQEELHHADVYKKHTEKLSARIKSLKCQLDEAEEEICKEKALRRKAQRECKDMLETQKLMTHEVSYLKSKLSRVSGTMGPSSCLSKYGSHHSEDTTVSGDVLTAQEETMDKDNILN